jgi:alpha-L-rhamnosidase
MPILAETDNQAVAYRLLLNDTYPSWGYSIKHGATSIWERWDGWTPDKGFQDPGMNSFAHYSFGAVYQWMVENIGGIRAEGPSYKEIAIDPRPGGRLTEACTFYNSIRGRIGTCWKKQGDKLMVEVTIPANTTATVFLPGSSSEKITESGKPLGSAEGVRVLRTEAGQVVLAVGSGNYKFMVPGSVR